MAGPRSMRTLELRPEHRGEFAAVLGSWLTGRVIVLGALALARYLVREGIVGAGSSAATNVHQGLLAWDASWYRDIARGGYGAVPRSGLRFFPLLPMVAQPLVAIGVPAGAAVVIVSNLAALVSGFLLYRLVLSERADHRLAGRAVWLLALAPPAYVFVLGYSDSLALTLALVAFLGARRGRWWWAVAAGVLIGLDRPTGLLLSVPLAIEAARTWRSAASAGGRTLRVAAVIAPFAGTGAYLAWVDARRGDALLPYRIQTSAGLHGRFRNPLDTISDAGRGLVHGSHIGTGLHVPWLVVLVVLVIVAARHWPASYSAFAAVTVAASITSSNLDSLERYALVAFPLVLAAAGLLTIEPARRTVYTLCAAALGGYALLAFLGAVVP